MPSSTRRVLAAQSSPWGLFSSFLEFAADINQVARMPLLDRKRMA
ncbi:hypothetical protein [Nitrospirillum amazonense]|nr:hypothetical protein [Nitrospirillum amazonense]